VTGIPMWQRGVSLVEMMVGLTLGLAMLAGMTSVYLGSKQTYRAGDALARLQESSRVAVEYLSRDLRNAGAWGCGAANLFPSRSYTCAAAQYNQGGLKNALLNGATTYAYNFALYVQGSDTTIGDTNWLPGLDASISGTAPAPSTGSDVLTVRGPESLSLTVTEHPASANLGAAPLKVRSTTELATGDIVVATDCEDAAVFQLTGISPAPDATNAERTLAHATGGTTPGNQCTELGKEYTDGLLMKAFTRTYYVAPGASGRPSLFRKEGPSATAVELVEGVENMQVQYGYDSDENGIADEYRTAAGVAAADWPRIVSVRVDLLLASAEDNITTEAQSYGFAGATATATDRRLRQSTSFTVGVRNRLH